MTNFYEPFEHDNIDDRIIQNWPFAPYDEAVNHFEWRGQNEDTILGISVCN